MISLKFKPLAYMVVNPATGRPYCRPYRHRGHAAAWLRRNRGWIGVDTNVDITPLYAIFPDDRPT